MGHGDSRTGKPCKAKGRETREAGDRPKDKGMRMGKLDKAT